MNLRLVHIRVSSLKRTVFVSLVSPTAAKWEFKMSVLVSSELLQDQVRGMMVTGEEEQLWEELGECHWWFCAILLEGLRKMNELGNSLFLMLYKKLSIQSVLCVQNIRNNAFENSEQRTLINHNQKQSSKTEKSFNVISTSVIATSLDVKDLIT